MAVAFSAGVGETTADDDENPADAADAPIGVKGAALTADTKVAPTATGATTTPFAATDAGTAATAAAGANEGMNGAADGDGTNGTKEAAVARSAGLGAEESDMVGCVGTEMRSESTSVADFGFLEKREG